MATEHSLRNWRRLRKTGGEPGPRPEPAASGLALGASPPGAGPAPRLGRASGQTVLTDRDFKARDYLYGLALARDPGVLEARAALSGAKASPLAAAWPTCLRSRTPALAPSGRERRFSIIDSAMLFGLVVVAGLRQGSLLKWFLANLTQCGLGFFEVLMPAILYGKIYNGNRTGAPPPSQGPAPVSRKGKPCTRLSKAHPRKAARSSPPSAGWTWSGSSCSGSSRPGGRPSNSPPGWSPLPRGRALRFWAGSAPRRSSGPCLRSKSSPMRLRPTPSRALVRRGPGEPGQHPTLRRGEGAGSQRLAG